MFLVSSDNNLEELSEKQKIQMNDEYFFVDLITEAVVIQKNDKIIHYNSGAVKWFENFRVNFELGECFYEKISLVAEEEKKQIEIKSSVGRIRNENYEFIQICDLSNINKEIERRVDLKIKEKEDELKKEIQQEKVILEKDIQQNKNKTEFFSDISHELRTPINILMSSVQLMDIYTKDLKTDKAKSIKKYLGVMKQNGYRLLRLVNNFLDITKIEAGYYGTDMNKHNIVEIIEDITQSVVEYMKYKYVEIIFDTDEEEIYVCCDEDKIERIMLNILANAVKYTPSGGKIEVNIYSREDSVDITIKDNGQGIPREKIGMVFDRFSQVNKSLTKKQEGTGIGLAIVKNFVEMQGGKIFVESTLGEGTEFKITLPIVDIGIEDESRSRINSNRKSGLIEKMNVEFSDIYSIACDE